MPEVESWTRFKQTVLDEDSAEIAAHPAGTIFTHDGTIDMAALEALEDMEANQRSRQQGLEPMTPRRKAPTKVLTKSPKKNIVTGSPKKRAPSKSPKKQVMPKSPKKASTSSPQKKAGPSASTSAPAMAPPTSPYKKIYARPAGTRSSTRLADRMEE